jgi:hypothetical protein
MIAALTSLWIGLCLIALIGYSAMTFVICCADGSSRWSQGSFDLPLSALMALPIASLGIVLGFALRRWLLKQQ